MNNHALHKSETVIIRLDTSLVGTKIKPTNQLRENEYENWIIDQINAVVKQPDIQLTDDENTGFTLCLGLFLGQPAIGIRFYDLLDYNNPVPAFTKDNPSKLGHLVEEKVCMYIDAINDAQVKFVTFDKDEFVQIYNGTLYGAFYDLEKGYIEPPKVEEKVFAIKTMKNNVQESVVNFISRA